MGVVIDDDDATFLADEVEAPTHAREGRECASRLRDIETASPHDAKHARGVEDVVTSGILRNLRLDTRAIGEAHGEGIAKTPSARNLEADVAIGTPLLAINDGSLANPTRNLCKSWIVRADDGSAIVR